MRQMNLSGLGAKSAMPTNTLPFMRFDSSELLSLSTMTSSKGNQRKWKTKDGRYYIKGCFRDVYREWRDDLVEVIASQYAGSCNLPCGVSVVAQGTCTVDGELASYSTAFDLGKYIFIPYNRARRLFLKQFDPFAGTPKECFLNIVSDISHIIRKDVTPFIVTMMLLDLIILNEDRHLNNFGLLLGEDDTLTVAPLFDFGLGLYEHDTCYDKNRQSLQLADPRLKPCWFKASDCADFLIDHCGQYWSDILPSVIYLSSFTFPSELLRIYFRNINERLGVKVVL